MNIWFEKNMRPDYMPAHGWQYPTNLLGAGRKQTWKVYLVHELTDEDLFLAPNDDHKYEGLLVHTFQACGNPRTNKIAMKHLDKILAKGFRVTFIMCVPTHYNIGRKYLNVRSRFARFAAAGVSVKTKTPVAI